MDYLIEYLNNRFPTRQPFTMNDGKRYAKIINGNSVYCFVAKSDFTTKGLGAVKRGDLLKPASWNTPAKHARGSLFDESTWEDAFGKYGMRYLK
jgi:hypothetical protein